MKITSTTPSTVTKQQWTHEHMRLLMKREDIIKELLYAKDEKQQQEHLEDLREIQLKVAFVTEMGKECEPKKSKKARK